MYYGKWAKKKSTLGKCPFLKQPLDLISVDFIVELPISNGNSKHILTIVDNFTKHLKVYAVPDRTSKTAAKCIYDYIVTYGIPFRLYSDRDAAYKAELFQELIKLLVIKKLRTTGYNAETNGLCEKLNDVVKQYLLKYTNFVGNEWDQWLREASYAYKRKKLTLKWNGPHKILSEKHPVYKMQINGKSKWLTRDELRKCEHSISDKMSRLIM